MGFKNAFVRDLTEQTAFFTYFTFHLPPNRNSDTIKSLSEVPSYDHEAESQMLRMVEQEDGRSLSHF